MLATISTLEETRSYANQAVSESSYLQFTLVIFQIETSFFGWDLERLE